MSKYLFSLWWIRNLNLLFCFLNEKSSIIRVKVYFENLQGLGWQCVSIGQFSHVGVCDVCFIVASWMFTTKNIMLDSKFKAQVSLISCFMLFFC